MGFLRHSKETGGGTAMRVNEIFYSLQGEGFFVGTPSVFIRLSGCNLRCPFCDTRHETGKLMDEDEVAAAAARYPARHTILTGGEPSLQLTSTLVDKLHAAGKFVAVETNGTHELPPNVDWITLSPKGGHAPGGDVLALSRCSELKLVYTEEGLTELYEGIEADHRFVQPCDVGDVAANERILRHCVDWCLAHPAWRLSLQMHKLIGVR